MRVYVGMDVHRKRSQVALVDEHGVQLANRNLPNDSTELVAVLGRLAPGTPVAFEAAYGWGWLAELLNELELEPHLVHPSRCKAIAAAGLKDDRVDACTLAQLLRAELLPEAWIAPQAVRDQRALLRHRAALVRVATALKCRVHAILADRGVRVEEPLWGPAGRVLLAELALPAVQRAIVTDCLALIDAISPLVTRLERDLVARARPDPRVQALQALPGIGLITAMTLVAEIGDIARFPTARKLCAWAGLTPAVRNSDRKVRHGHITKMGSPWVRFVLHVVWESLPGCRSGCGGLGALLAAVQLRLLPLGCAIWVNCCSWQPSGLHRWIHTRHRRVVSSGLTLGRSGIPSRRGRAPVASSRPGALRGAGSSQPILVVGPRVGGMTAAPVSPGGG